MGRGKPRVDPAPAPAPAAAKRRAPAEDRAAAEAAAWAQLTSANERRRSESWLEIRDPGRWGSWSREQSETALISCRLPMDPGVWMRVGGERSGASECDAMTRALLIAPAPAAEACWGVGGEGFSKRQAKAFLALGGLGASAPRAWPASLRAAVFGALLKTLPEQAVWAELREAIGWMEPYSRPSWALGAGLAPAGLAQRSDPLGRESGRLGEMARAALASWAEQMSEPEIQAWAGLARGGPAMSEARAGAWQLRLAQAAGAHAELAVARCSALKLTGEALRLAPGVMETGRASMAGANREGAHPAWMQWGAGQSDADAVLGFEALMSACGEWPGARCPSMAILESVVPLGSFGFGRALAFWMDQSSGPEARLDPGALLLGESRGGSLPAEMALSRHEGFEKLVGFIANKGWLDFPWPAGDGETLTLARLTESWSQGRAIVESAALSGAAGSGGAEVRRGPRL